MPSCLQDGDFTIVCGQNRLKTIISHLQDFLPEQIGGGAAQAGKEQHDTAGIFLPGLNCSSNNNNTAVTHSQARPAGTGLCSPHTPVRAVPWGAGGCPGGLCFTLWLPRTAAWALGAKEGDRAPCALQGCTPTCSVGLAGTPGALENAAPQGCFSTRDGIREGGGTKWGVPKQGVPKQGVRSSPRTRLQP